MRSGFPGRLHDSLTPEQIIFTAVVLAFGALVQSVIGFGLGVVVIPLLVWGGWTLPEAICMVLPNVFVQSLLNCWQNQDELPWKDALEVFIPRMISLPIGIVLLQFISEAGESLTRQILGVGLILMLILQQMTRRSNIKLKGRTGAILAGTSSGFLAGLIGMGGAPLIFFVIGKNWSNARQRGFLWLNFLLIVPLQLLIMGITLGVGLTKTMALGLAFSPVALLVAWWGAKIGNAIATDRLRLCMQLLLLLIAARLIVW